MKETSRSGYFFSCCLAQSSRSTLLAFIGAFALRLFVSSDSTLVHKFHWKLGFYGTAFNVCIWAIYAENFVKVCSGYADWTVVTIVKVAFKYSKSFQNKSDLKFGVTSTGTQCCTTIVFARHGAYSDSYLPRGVQCKLVKCDICAHLDPSFTLVFSTETSKPGTYRPNQGCPQDVKSRDRDFPFS